MLGWSSSTFEIYENTFKNFGGSVNMAPELLKHFMRCNFSTFEFWHYSLNGIVKAAYFTANKSSVGLNIWNDYPVSYDEIIFPIEQNVKVFLPTKTSRLSNCLRNNVINSLFYRRKRKVCLIKNTFSGKTIKKRNRELNNLLESGGVFYCLKDITPKEIAQLYVHLFNKRFYGSIKCYNEDKIVNLLTNIPNMISGHVLFYKNNPCAIDLALKAESDKNIYVDIPNGGYDPFFSDLSPGSMLMWKNIIEFQKMSQMNNKEMIISIGCNDKRWEYKSLWAFEHNIGKVIAI